MTAPSRLADALARLREETRLAEAHLATLADRRTPEAPASTTPTPHKETR